MFDITGDDVARLNDSDFRTLVARLALAEIARLGGPASAVTAGGDQDASDGGLDVHVDLPAPLAGADFLPRGQVGFQVKKPDMPASQIRSEMRFKGPLRPAIAALADAGGAYIIASAQGTVDHRRLGERRVAMRQAVDDHPEADRLYLDFYDRTRLATWANQYPGISAWIRARIGNGFAGWRAIGRWHGTLTAGDRGFLVDEAACLVDESSKEREPLPILAGIERLRARLGEPRQCVRLIGLSGLGKTRLVEALFEDGVGDAALDPGLAVYTDYSEDTEPSARELARRLVDEDARAILIIDNCNPATHAELTAICSRPASRLSLLTVEYDVQDDEPERTDVFRLTGVQRELLETWIGREFPDLSSIDAGRIARFSEGNFRVARALAETVGRGETLGQLKDRELFARLFDQRNARDPQLFDNAKLLALVYSFDGENCDPDGELATIGNLFGTEPLALYKSAVELKRRGIVQARGRWRAILPQAIANRLASIALEEFPAARLDSFCLSLPPRLLRSFCTRLGYLHDSPAARSAVQRWLRPGGPMAGLVDDGKEGFDLLRVLAPVMPREMLDYLLGVIAGRDGLSILAVSNRDRWRWHGLLKALAYEPELFDDAATALAGFVAVEPEDHRDNSATRPFTELFQMRLSGTHASPEQRRALAARLLDHPLARLQRAGEIALGALLQASHFTSSSSADFGARSRDHGWCPATYGDIYAWFNEAIGLATRFGVERPGVRAVLASHLRTLWQFPTTHDALEQAADRFAEAGGWNGGWIALRGTQYYDRKSMPPEMADRLAAIIDRLKPDNLLDRARSLALNQGSGGWDVAEADEGEGIMAAHRRAYEAAVTAGRAMAIERDMLASFLPELIGARQAARAPAFGRGLAEGCTDLASCWEMLSKHYRAAGNSQRNMAVLAGFLAGAHGRDPKFAGPLLEGLLDDPDLIEHLPSLQASVSVEADGLDRLRRATGRPGLRAQAFSVLGTGIIADCPAGPLAELLSALASMEDGAGVALDLLQMRIHCAEDDPKLLNEELIRCGRRLLLQLPFSDRHVMRDHWTGQVVQRCLGDADEAEARMLCVRLRDALEDCTLSWHDAELLMTALFKAQPRVALEIFLLADAAELPWEYGIERASPLEGIEIDLLRRWADEDSATRYPLLGRALAMFTPHGIDTDSLSPHYLAMLRGAPDRLAFLSMAQDRFRPSGWVGSLAAKLEVRLALLDELKTLGDPVVDTWLAQLTPEIQARIDRERARERQQEESFEA